VFTHVLLITPVVVLITPVFHWRAATTTLQWTGRVKGQSIMEMISLYRLCQWPLHRMVTDGS
jgi:hypothetical protein